MVVVKEYFAELSEIRANSPEAQKNPKLPPTEFDILISIGFSSSSFFLFLFSFLFFSFSFFFVFFIFYFYFFIYFFKKKFLKLLFNST